MRSIHVALIFAAGLSFCDLAQADTWPPPKTEVYVSSDQQWRLTVTPRAIESPLNYFEDKVAKRPNPGAVPDNLQKSAQGYVEHLVKGAWEPVWNAPLENEVAPVTAIVMAGGRVATFDNWSSTGYGNDVVVLYDNHGDMVRSLALKDFLPKNYIHALPHSVSSILWSGEHHVSADGSQLQLSVVVPPDPAARGSMGSFKYVEIAIKVANG